MAQKTEHCENCGNVIGRLEQAFVHEGHIVCEKCYEKLKNGAISQAVTKSKSAKVIDTTQLSQPRCNLCGGAMVKKTVSSGNVAGIALALLVLAAGLFLTFGGLFCGGPFIGIPLCILALFMGGKRSKVLKCEKCGNTVPRA